LQRKVALEARKRSHGISSKSESADRDSSASSDDDDDTIRPRRSSLSQGSASLLRKSKAGVSHEEKKSEKDAENALNDMLGQLVTGREGGKESTRSTGRRLRGPPKE